MSSEPKISTHGAAQCSVNAGLVDEFSLALSPVRFGSGIRLFEGVNADRVALEQVRAEPTQRVTHLTYAVRQRQPSRTQRSAAEVSRAARTTTL
jgi:dihydrofolate reductase